MEPDKWWEDYAREAILGIVVHPWPQGVDLGSLVTDGEYDAIGAWAAFALVNVYHEFTSVDEMVAKLAGKQRDYGPQNIIACPIGTVEGIKVRLWDKIARYMNLVNRPQDAVNESIVDTLFDIIGYVTIYRMVVDGTFETPLKPIDHGMNLAVELSADYPYLGSPDILNIVRAIEARGLLVFP